jgi:hypothetical protein
MREKISMKGRFLSTSAVLACVGSAIGVVLGGCSGGSAVSSVFDPVAQAAEASERAPGFKVLVSDELTPPNSSQTTTGSGTGVVGQHGHRGSMSIKVNAEGHSSTAEEQYTSLALYMHLSSASQSSSVTHGKPWVKFDFRRLGAALGINDSALVTPGASSNPSELLSYLKATSGQVTRVGTERVQGVPMTHYRATIDYNQIVARTAPAQRSAASESVTALERLTGSSSQPIDVWIDGRHRVRREEYIESECLPSASGATKIHLKIEFFDFGVQAIPPLPRSREVADVTSYVGEKLKHIKLGCQ